MFFLKKKKRGFQSIKGGNKQNFPRNRTNKKDIEYTKTKC